MRTYSELSQCRTFEERFAYLKLVGVVGESTFGFERFLNQGFYHSTEWKQARSSVIARDEGWDLGSRDFRIRGKPVIHHMNPLTARDIEESTDNLLKPEFLISTSLRTHNAIHYGNEQQLPQPFVERTPHDTSPWRLAESSGV